MGYINDSNLVRYGLNKSWGLKVFSDLPHYKSHRLLCLQISEFISFFFDKSKVLYRYKLFFSHLIIRGSLNGVLNVDVFVYDTIFLQVYDWLVKTVLSDSKHTISFLSREVIKEQLATTSKMRVKAIITPAFILDENRIGVDRSSLYFFSKYFPIQVNRIFFKHLAGFRHKCVYKSLENILDYKLSHIFPLNSINIRIYSLHSRMLGSGLISRFFLSSIRQGRSIIGTAFFITKRLNGYFNGLRLDCSGRLGKKGSRAGYRHIIYGSPSIGTFSSNVDYLRVPPILLRYGTVSLKMWLFDRYPVIRYKYSNDFSSSSTFGTYLCSLNFFKDY